MLPRLTGGDPLLFGLLHDDLGAFFLDLGEIVISSLHGFFLYKLGLVNDLHRVFRWLVYHVVSGSHLLIVRGVGSFVIGGLVVSHAGGAQVEGLRPWMGSCVV